MPALGEIILSRQECARTVDVTIPSDWLSRFVIPFACPHKGSCAIFFDPGVAEVLTGDYWQNVSYDLTVGDIDLANASCRNVVANFQGEAGPIRHRHALRGQTLPFLVCARLVAVRSISSISALPFQTPPEIAKKRISFQTLKIRNRRCLARSSGTAST